MATISTVSNPKGSTATAVTDLRKFAPPSQSTRDSNSLAPAQGSVYNDLYAGVVAGATSTGPSRVRPAGRDVVVAGWVSAPGTIILETSQDGGTTWPLTDSEAIPAGEYVVARAVVNSSTTHYRIKFVCGPVGASKVALSTQPRT